MNPYLKIYNFEEIDYDLILQLLQPFLHELNLGEIGFGENSL
jgi:hypothetical protein